MCACMCAFVHAWVSTEYRTAAELNVIMKTTVNCTASYVH